MREKTNKFFLKLKINLYRIYPVVEECDARNNYQMKLSIHRAGFNG